MIKIRLFCLIALLMISKILYADNMQFLKDSPIRYYTSQDWELFIAAQTKALNMVGNGNKVSWRNPESGSEGYFIPLARIKNAEGITCRDLTIFNSSNHRTDEMTMTYCQYGKVWKVI